MGYNLNIYSIDINAVKSLIGSKDITLMKDLLLKEQESIDKNTEWFQEDIQKGMPLLNKAISQIFSGRQVY